MEWDLLRKTVELLQVIDSSPFSWLDYLLVHYSGTTRFSTETIGREDPYIG